MDASVTSSSNSFSESPHHTILGWEKGPVRPGAVAGLIGSGTKERGAGETGQDSPNGGGFQNPWNTADCPGTGAKAVESIEEHCPAAGLNPQGFLCFSLTLSKQSRIIILM